MRGLPTDTGQPSWSVAQSDTPSPVQTLISFKKQQQKRRQQNDIWSPSSLSAGTGVASSWRQLGRPGCQQHHVRTGLPAQTHKVGERSGVNLQRLHCGQNSIDRLHQSMGSPADQERIKAEVRPSEEMEEEGSTSRVDLMISKEKKKSEGFSSGF